MPDSVQIAVDLNKSWGNLNTATKLAKKLHEKVADMTDLPRVRSLVSEMVITMEEADACLADMHFMIKYKKVKGSSAAISRQAAAEMITKADGFSQALIMDCKLLKGATGAKP